jgi:hypothetical protein
MTTFPLQALLAASAVILFAADPHWYWERRVDRRKSRGAVCVPIAVVCALTVLSGIAAVEYPLSFTDVFNQF